MDSSLKEKSIDASNYGRQELIELMFCAREISKDIEQRGSVDDNFEAYKFSAYAFRGLIKNMEDLLEGFNEHIEELSSIQD